MAERAKGSIFYEILIVVLAAGLIFTITYPSKTWQQQDELQNVCRERMSALQQLEYRYMENTDSFTVDIAALKENVVKYPEIIDALDSTINWDRITTTKTIVNLINGLNLPDQLREEIASRLDQKKPLWALAEWDSLGFRLVDEMDAIMQDSMFNYDSLDVAIDWRGLVGENTFWDILSSEDISRRILNRANLKVQRGKSINEIKEWKYFAPLFHKELVSMIKVAQSKDVWAPSQKEKWEIYRKKQWDAEMDTLPQALRDTVWHKYQEKLWEKNKELLWKEQWKSLYAAEKETWIENNKDVWSRIVEKNWIDQRKKQWIIQKKNELPDSLVAIFATIRDSLWRLDRDSLFTNEFESWKAKNKKEINNIIKNLWERERRLTWTGEMHDKWISDQEQNPEKLWDYLKFEVWLIEKDNLWRQEEKKYTMKKGVMYRFNKNIKWKTIIGEDRISEIVDNLNLPDKNKLLSMYKKELKKGQNKKSILYKLGLVSLLRNQLFENMHLCPVAQEPLKITVVDTTIVPKFEIKCPVVDTGKTPFVVKIDTASGDTVNIDLKLPFFKKVFGGGEIRSHGYIDLDGKKSWEKKTR